MEIGSGQNAIITLTDTTMRGGQIVGIHSDELLLLIAGQTVTFARSNIVLVTVKRPSKTAEFALGGFLVTGVGITAALCLSENADCEPLGWLLGIGLFGLPGALLGALAGIQTGGDVEIIP